MSLNSEDNFDEENFQSMIGSPEGALLSDVNRNRQTENKNIFPDTNESSSMLPGPSSCAGPTEDSESLDLSSSVIQMYSLTTDQTLQSFKSAMIAAKVSGVKISYILDVINGRMKSVDEYGWRMGQADSTSAAQQPSNTRPVSG